MQISTTMKYSKFLFVCLAALFLSSCATGYKMIEPNSLNYLSVKEDNGVKFEYKYDLLNKKYSKKEEKKGMRVVAVKVTNNSGRDLTFGDDLKLSYENGNIIYIMDSERVLKTLRQKTATYLLYLLLTPMNLTTTETNNGITETNTIFPIGLVVGPAITGINMITAGSANKKFRQELEMYNINGETIKDGETKVGLIGIRSDTYDALMLKME